MCDDPLADDYEPWMYNPPAFNIEAWRLHKAIEAFEEDETEGTDLRW